MGDIRIVSMTEEDIKLVMPLEIASFPDPWTPLAFAEDIRNNPCARYFVAKDAFGTLCGYLGYWIANDRVDILKIAVADAYKKQGLGKALVEAARKDLGDRDYVRVFVRAKNYGAQSFYRTLGFQDAGLVPNYYVYPPDDALVMISSDSP